MAIPLNKVMRDLEDDMKKDLNDIKETIKGLADSLQRIEAKVDLLATKADGRSGGHSSYLDRGYEGPFNGGYGHPLSYLDRGFEGPFDGGYENPSSLYHLDRGYEGPFDGGYGNPSSLYHLDRGYEGPFDGSYGRPWPYFDSGYVRPLTFVGTDDQTITVKGFDSSLPEYYIKSKLTKYFSSCGEVMSVVLPTDNVTGAEDVISCVLSVDTVEALNRSEA
ncbi:hypothetical protein AALP_AA2G161800 [Arabis alpina]|uniref:RRM domain-containing protein n=1 Tax=Arabis alpina TaxID=50452 RepID=A0A087HHV0_ARAAL|nr:hypothetical protein AALP_AA2G161800 [Arabis alpina]